MSISPITIITIMSISIPKTVHNTSTEYSVSSGNKLNAKELSEMTP